MPESAEQHGGKQVKVRRQGFDIPFYQRRHYNNGCNQYPQHQPPLFPLKSPKNRHSQCEREEAPGHDPGADTTIPVTA